MSFQILLNFHLGSKKEEERNKMTVVCQFTSNYTIDGHIIEVVIRLTSVKNIKLFLLAYPWILSSASGLIPHTILVIERRIPICQKKCIWLPFTLIFWLCHSFRFVELSCSLLVFNQIVFFLHYTKFPESVIKMVPFHVANNYSSIYVRGFCVSIDKKS